MGEHLELCRETRLRRRAPRLYIVRQNRLPSRLGGRGKRLRGRGIYIAIGKNIVAPTARRNLHKVEVLLNKAQRLIVRNRLNGLWPVARVIIKLAKSRHKNTQLVLRARNVGRTRRIFHAKEDFRIMLGVTVGQFGLPKFNCLITARSRHTTALIKVVVRMNRNRQNRARTKLIHERLVEPTTAKLNPKRNPTDTPNGSRRPRGESRTRNALRHNKFNAALLAKTLLVRRETVRIHKKDVWFEGIDFLLKVH